MKRGFSQTEKHQVGDNGYYQVGLVRGQFGAMPKADWLDGIDSIGFDGYEEASWELDLARCATDDGAAEYAKELIDQAHAGGRGLQIFSLAAHLQGQALGDEAYKSWRAAGNEPPRTDPFYVPPEVAALIRQQAETDLIATIRLAHFLGKLQGRRVVVSGFVGSPANCWSHWFGFPPLPKLIGNYEIPNVLEVSLELLIERFQRVFETLNQYDVYFGLECHPSERAMGDISSAQDFLKACNKAGFETRVGFNLDASHMVWQGVDPIAFIREFSDRIFSVHIKGVQVIDGPTENGLLGGHRPMGHPLNGWNFVTPGCQRDSVPQERILTELRRIGYNGAVSIEWEDNDADPIHGAELALNMIEDMNLPPSNFKHDEALKAKA
jgi:sugar phosphate isomerase/epimerase